MQTIISIFQADWGPTMRGVVYALGYAIAIPAAIVVVLAQWLAFTYRRPLAGALALVPVRSNSGDPGSSPNLAVSPPNLATAMADIAVISEAVDANIRAALQDLNHLSSSPPVLAPGPRRQRRGSKRPQSPA